MGDDHTVIDLRGKVCVESERVPGGGFWAPYKIRFQSANVHSFKAFLALKLHLYV